MSAKCWPKGMCILLCFNMICYSAKVRFPNSCIDTTSCRSRHAQKTSTSGFSLCVGSFSRSIVCAHSDVIYSIYSFTIHHHHFSGQSKSSGWREGEPQSCLQRLEAMPQSRYQTDMAFIQIRYSRRNRRIYQHRLPRHANGCQSNLLGAALCSHALSCAGRLLDVSRLPSWLQDESPFH